MKERCARSSRPRNQWPRIRAARVLRRQPHRPRNPLQSTTGLYPIYPAQGARAPPRDALWGVARGGFSQALPVTLRNTFRPRGLMTRGAMLKGSLRESGYEARQTPDWRAALSAQYRDWRCAARDYGACSFFSRRRGNGVRSRAVKALIRSNAGSSLTFSKNCHAARTSRQNRTRCAAVTRSGRSSR